MKLTEEQERIVEASRTSRSLVVNALAGSGKTSTAVACAVANRGERGAYFSFNRANAGEMRDKLRRAGCENSMKAMTIHSLAYRLVAVPLLGRGREVGGIFPQDVADNIAFKDKNGRTYNRFENLRAGRIALDCLSDWCHSAYRDIGEFFENYNNDKVMFQLRIMKLDKGEMFKAVRFLWEQSLDNPQVPLSHDAYLKIFHVNFEQFRRSLPFDFIIADEAQDLFPVAEDIVVRMNQGGARLLCLGDRYQQIYAWNRSINTMSRMEAAGDTVLSLTKSFRCGEEVVKAALPWLRLMGYKGEFRPRTEESARSDLAVLSRTNMGVLGCLCQCVMEGMPPDSINLVGGARSYNFDMARDRIAFIQNRKDMISHPGMRGCEDDVEYDLYAQSSLDSEMRQAKLVIESFGVDRIKKIIGYADSGAFASDSVDADISISTAHKAKGLEFGDVAISSSFTDFREEYLTRNEPVKASPGLMPDEFELSSMERRKFEREHAREDGGAPMAWDSEEFRLNYVAITRAISRITLNKLDIRSNLDFSSCVSYLDNNEIVLYDRDQDGNLQDFEPRRAQYARLREAAALAAGEKNKPKARASGFKRM